MATIPQSLVFLTFFPLAKVGAKGPDSSGKCLRNSAQLKALCSRTLILSLSSVNSSYTRLSSSVWLATVSSTSLTLALLVSSFSQSVGRGEVVAPFRAGAGAILLGALNGLVLGMTTGIGAISPEEAGVIEPRENRSSSPSSEGGCTLHLESPPLV